MASRRRCRCPRRARSRMKSMQLNRLVSGGVLTAALTIAGFGNGHVAAQPSRAIPRTADGRPNLDGIWKVQGQAAADLQAVVSGGTIPYQPAAAQKKAQNFANRATADPL